MFASTSVGPDIVFSVPNSARSKAKRMRQHKTMIPTPSSKEYHSQEKESNKDVEVFVETEATTSKRDNLESVFINVHGRYGGQNTEDYGSTSGAGSFGLYAGSRETMAKESHDRINIYRQSPSKASKRGKTRQKLTIGQKNLCDEIAKIID